MALRLPIVAVLAALSSGAEFGIYDVQKAGDVASQGWRPMGAVDFEAFKNEFITSYNKGLKVIKPFKGGDCCLAVDDGKMLFVTGTQFGYQYPGAGGKAVCQPSRGYSGKLKFWNSETLTENAAFSSKVYKDDCKLNHNPAVFIRMPRKGIQFKFYDVANAPAGGWRLMSAADLNKHKNAFIKYYNTNKGLNVVKSFPSGNCCIAVKGGKMLVLKGSATGYQFPAASVKGGQQMRCNPAKGYTGKYTLFGSPMINRNHEFTAASGCKVDHNPAIYALYPTDVKIDNSKDCVVSDWSDWSACGVGCPSKDNIGLRVRHREVIQKRSNGGKRCPRLRQQRKCKGKNTCCSHTTCTATFRGAKDKVTVYHASQETKGRHHICEVGLFKVGKCDCECGTLGVTIHSRLGHSPCMIWGSFKDCDNHRGSQDFMHNRVPEGGVLKVEAEYGYLANLQRKPLPYFPRQRMNGELEKTATHMFVAEDAVSKARYNQQGFAEWQVYAEATGEYRVAFHYSNPTGRQAAAQVVTTVGNWDDKGARSVHLVNFAPTLPEKFTFVNAHIKLVKGVNTFRVRTLANKPFPGLDFFRIADLGTNFDLAKINDMDRSIARQVDSSS